MAEYIDREAVVRELNKTYDNMNAMGAQFYGGFMNAVYRIKDFPAADVAPVRHGRWISVPHKLAMVCSVCNRDEPYKFADIDADVYDYCPTCGAKMDG